MPDKFELNEFKSCGRCRDGYLFRRDKNDEEFATPCPCRITYEKDELLRLNLYKSGISYDVINYDINSYVGNLSLDHVKKLKKFVKEFKPKFKCVNLYFWSKKNSTQKTTLAKWIARSLLEKGLTTRFILMDTLIKYLQTISFDDGSEKVRIIKTKIDQCCNVDFLIIDDSFDLNKITLYKSKYQLPFLDSFLRERLEQYKKSTCFTSNVPIEKIGDNFGISIEKLVERNIILPMQFKDYVFYKDKDKLKELW